MTVLVIGSVVTVRVLRVPEARKNPLFGMLLMSVFLVGRWDEVAGAVVAVGVWKSERELRPSV